MQRYDSYAKAEDDLIGRIVEKPEFVTKTTYERFNEGFVLTNPLDNMNYRSNYAYAAKFFKWMISGEKQLSKELLEMNPWVERFVDDKGLPKDFSASYGWKIKIQLPGIIHELKTHLESRRGYVNVLLPDDQVVLNSDTTHEFPCTIGLHFFVRDSLLHLMVNMRSNNCIKVMPYDVFNFTYLQYHVSKLLDIPIGSYYHQINSAHVFKGDARRWKEQK